ncbi:hypothetical protein DRV84_10420 [Rhodosalinus sediminis]|uniref:DUF6671 domain-containing protein n=1 Tax=Rhodosalinus sediminis TaxID=1940533 RepID=A0A3D9BRA7_9RHOB|nr:DUF6671 family protein [Rhodosalinus sediminis]REC56030.1 hypothetical protein DRV84_10420 [Rhodosalinus sediminis]
MSTRGSGLWAGRIARLATMHGKEAALAPPLARAGLELRRVAGVDTDALGTFTGEIPRAGSLHDAAEAKARLAIELSRGDLGLGSEGAYGPHPQIPVIPQGVETLVLVDAARDLVLSETMEAPRPVYDHAEAAALPALEPFLARIGFPGHAVIVQPKGGGPARKGLRARTALARAVAEAAEASADGLAVVQTDMRAHMNPTRMRALAALAERFAERLTCPCPACGAPGWGPVRPGPALPCACCGGATLTRGAPVRGCAACAHEAAEASATAQADPMHCPACNP